MKKTIAIISCLFFILSAGIFVSPQMTRAVDAIKFNPQISIPDSQFQKVECDKKTMTPEEYAKCGYTVTERTIGEYIQAIYNYAIGIVGILAAVVLMWGGVVWLTSGGSAERVKSAKSWIGAALSGLVLVLTSYLILNTINPDLVNFKPLKMADVKKDGLEDISCKNYSTESICISAVGCKWKDGKCILNTGYAKCGLTAVEKVGIARCCKKNGEFKYALVPLNNYCIDVCGSGWINVDGSECESNLGY